MKKLIEDKRKEYQRRKERGVKRSVSNNIPRSFIMNKVDKHFNKKIGNTLKKISNMPAKNSQNIKQIDDQIFDK